MTGNPRLNVENFTKAAIDSYQHRRQTVDRDTAFKTTVAAHAAVAADRYNVPLSRGAEIVKESIKQYRNADQRLDHHAARDQAARTVAAQFDDQGRRQDQQQNRQRIWDGISL